MLQSREWKNETTMKNWYVYLLECADKTLYCGITTNMEKRLANHNLGKGAKYTKSRRPVKIVFFIGGFTITEALRLESKVKKQRKDKKLAYLITR